MKKQRQTSEERIANSQSKAVIIGAVITAIATIVVGLLAGVRLPNKAKPEVYEFAVNQQKFPFERSPVELHKGDTVEVVVLGAHSLVLDCGTGATTVMGVVNHQDQHLSVLQTANVCSLIGRIGSDTNPYFPVGAYAKLVADLDGALYLGINDAPPGNCAKEDCFSDNKGSFTVQVAVTRN